MLTKSSVGWMMAVVAAAWCFGCRPSDILSVPVPPGVTGASSLDNAQGAESAFNTARYQIFTGFEGGLFTGGLLPWTEALSDEFSWSDFSYYVYDANIDARMTAESHIWYGDDDNGYLNVLTGRGSMLLTIPLLERYEPAAGRSKVGEAFALVGYTELVMAEGYCAGTTLSQVLPGGGYQFGMPLTTDSLLGVAEADFDSALAHAHGDPTVTSLASVGLGRTLLGRGRYDSAATVVATTPTGFVYNTDLPPTYGQGGLYTVNMYSELLTNTFGTFRIMTVADHEGGNGLNYRSASDPRVVVDSSLGTTVDGVTWYFPAKFEGKGQEFVPLATGVEARLVQAETALHHGQIGTWAADLNALRATLSMLPLPADSTTTASATQQVDVMFRERAFWLYGTGTRLGDMRRLVHQYGRDQRTVFPTGPYPNGTSSHLPAPLPTYGTDVSLTPPNGSNFGHVNNPNFKGCTDHNS